MVLLQDGYQNHALLACKQNRVVPRIDMNIHVNVMYDIDIRNHWRNPGFFNKGKWDKKIK